MDADLPRRSRTYSGPATETDIWDQFTPRASDVFVSTPPKCGTTWTQTMVRILITGQADPAVYDNGVAPWLDCAFRGRSEQLARLNAQDNRRCIKSHTPMDGMIYDPDATYIAVYRHPIDVHFSFRDHVANMKADWFDYLYEGTTAEAFDRFLAAEPTAQGTDDLSLASIVHHYRSFRTFAGLPNIHLFHYAQMRADPVGQLQRLSDILGYGYDPERIEVFARAASFERMKDNARARAAEPGFDSAFVDYAKFYASASSNKWDGKLTRDDLSAYDRRMAALLSAADRDWLNWGRGDPHA
ncbi:MAG: sulfotransferase domain-containing protein [Marinibacterium sp.]